MNNLHSWLWTRALRVHGFRHTQESIQRDTRAGGRRRGRGEFLGHKKKKSQAAEMKGKRKYVKEVWGMGGGGGGVAVSLMEVSV